MSKIANASPLLHPFHRYPSGSQAARVYEPYRSTPSRNPSKPLILNAAGRYQHQRDQHTAPLDPNFGGAGRTLTAKDRCTVDSKLRNLPRQLKHGTKRTARDAENWENGK